jgi:hypothetical protein
MTATLQEFLDPFFLEVVSVVVYIVVVQFPKIQVKYCGPPIVVCWDVNRAIAEERSGYSWC